MKRYAFLFIPGLLLPGCGTDEPPTSRSAASAETSETPIGDRGIEPQEALAASGQRNRPFSISSGSTLATPNALIEGNRQVAEGDLDAAIASYRKYLRQSPDSREGHLKLAFALIESDEVAQATAHLDWLIQRHADDPRAYVYRAMLSLRKQQWQRSLEDLEAAIERGSDSPQNRGYLSLAFLNLRDFSAAKREADVAIAGDPNLKDAYFVRCIARAYLADPEGARKDLEEAKRCGLEERLIVNCEEAIRAAAKQ